MVQLHGFSIALVNHLVFSALLEDPQLHHDCQRMGFYFWPFSFDHSTASLITSPDQWKGQRCFLPVSTSFRGTILTSFPGAVLSTLVPLMRPQGASIGIGCGLWELQGRGFISRTFTRDQRTLTSTASTFLMSPQRLATKRERSSTRIN